MPMQNHLIDLSKPWAILPSRFEALAKLVKQAQAPEPTRVGGSVKMKITDEGIAIIPILGEMLRQDFGDDGFFFLFGSIASTQRIMEQVGASLEDKDVKGILLDINSPGGETDGIPELGEMIMSGRTIKPIVAYVSTLGASAGFWIATAASTVVVHETSQVGSIGVLAQFFDFGESEFLETIVSDVSPEKFIDPSSDEGKAKIQKTVNTLGRIFAEKVALQRAVSVETVVNDFGKGDVVFGKEAVKRGMADQVGNFRVALDLLRTAISETAGTKSKSKSKSKRSNAMKLLIKAIISGMKAKLVVVDTDEEGVVVPDDATTVEEIDKSWIEENLPEVAQEFRDEGGDSENARQDDMDGVAAQDDAEKAIVQTARRDRKISASDVALSINKHQQSQVGQTVANRTADAGKIPAITDEEPDSQAKLVEADVLAIVAGAESRRKQLAQNPGLNKASRS